MMSDNGQRYSYSHPRRVSFGLRIDRDYRRRRHSRFMRSLAIIFVFTLIIGQPLTIEASSVSGTAPEATNAEFHSDDPTVHGPVLRVRGGHDFVPFEFLNENGQPDGFDVDIFHAIARTMGLRYEIEMGLWKTIRSELETGKIDLLLGMFRSVERDRKIDFSLPTMTMSYMIFVREGSEIRTLDDIRGKKIVVQEADFAHDYLILQNMNANIVVENSLEMSLLNLSAGKADGAIVGYYPGLILIKNRELTNIEPVGRPILQRDICMAVAEGNASLAASLNEGLLIIKSTGEYDRIFDKWFGAYEIRSLDSAQLAKEIFWIILSLASLVIAAFVWLWLLRRQVGIKTAELSQELAERRLTEAARRESEAKYRSFVEGTRDLVTQVNNKGELTFVNHTAREVYGLEPQECIGLSAFEFIHPDDRDRTIEAFEGWLHDKQESITFENRQVSRTGQVRDTIWTCNLIFDNTGQLMMINSMARDITERKAAEQSLRESKERFRLLAEASLEGIAIGVEGITIDANQQFADMLGYSLDEIAGLPIRQFIAPDSWETARQNIVSGFGELYELNLLRKDGTLMPAEVRGKMYSYEGKRARITAVRDLTERKKAERALRESEESFRSLYSTMSEGLCLHEIIYDDSNKAIDYRIIDFNASYESILKIVRRDAIGKLASELYDTDEPPNMDVYARVAQTGVPANFECYFAPLKKHFSISVHSPAKGKFATLFADITEINRLRKLESRAERLEAAGKIAGQVAHDFNNLLAPLMAYPEFIREELPADHSAQSMISDIESAAGKIADINRQLLTLGRRGHYNMEPLSINTIVKQTIKDMGRIPGTLNCHTTYAENLLPVLGGSAQTYRAIANLIRNARDAMEDKGCLDIRTENFYVDDRSKMLARIPIGEYVKLTITDNGCGIPEEIAYQLYDPFFTTKATDQTKGSGLGLSIVDAVMKDHHGYVDYETCVNKGTTFYLYFPICRQEVSQPEIQNYQGGSESILVVDDDSVQCEVTLKLLGRLGYQTIVAASGEEAIEVLRQKPHDLLILDMVMPPGIDGAETYRRALEINASQKAIVVSGYAESERVKLVLAMGAGAFIAKPVTQTILAVAVRAELDRSVTVPV